MKPELKPPRTINILTIKYDELPSNCAFNFNSRHTTAGGAAAGSNVRVVPLGDWKTQEEDPAVGSGDMPIVT